MLATGEEAVDANDFDDSNIEVEVEEFDENLLDSRLDSQPSQTLSTPSSFTSSLRKRAGTATAASPFESLKRAKKTGFEHLADAVRSMTTSNEHQTSAMLKSLEVQTPMERALELFFLAFKDIDVDDKVRMTDVFENEAKSRAFLAIKDLEVRRRWVDNQLKRML